MSLKEYLAPRDGASKSAGPANPKRLTVSPSCRPRAEYRLADADVGRAERDRELEISAHSHR